MEQDVLYGKTIVALGDSLIYGSKLGNEATWVNKIAKKHNMKVFNYGINGNPVAMSDGCDQTPMCVRYADMQDGADYVVVLGGANDKRLDVPIGEDDSTDPRTFKGALNILIDGLTAKYPKAKILFLTNYRRWDNPNKLGMNDIYYVRAMEDICHLRSIPCFNNYYNAGISFFNPAHLAWMDEGLVLDGKENHHFSDEAYTWLANRYEAVLKML